MMAGYTHLADPLLCFYTAAQKADLIPWQEMGKYSTVHSTLNDLRTVAGDAN